MPGFLIRMAHRRMWRVHMPVIITLLTLSTVLSGLDNGAAALLALLAGAAVLVALLDWFGAEFAATRVD